MDKPSQRLYKNLPDSPGVYIMKGARGKILYIGKAGNVKRRVSSYFLRPHDARIEKMVGEIKKIDFKKTESALEALILEAELIKKYKPPFNIREKDDKSFLYVEITDEEYPRVLLVRGKTKPEGRRFGPYTSASSVREALRIIRRIFPYSTHTAKERGGTKPCFNYQIHLCPGTCIGAVSKQDYKKTIRNIVLLFQGKGMALRRKLEREMRHAALKLRFEEAEKLKRQLFALRHIQDTALMSGSDSQLSKTKNQKLFRIEGYDVSNISGTSAVGAMAVFEGGKPNKNEYRKFRIRSFCEPNDVGMLREVLERRFSHREWPIPDMILVDGGKAQVNVAAAVLEDAALKIPIVGIAKGPKRNKNEFIGNVPVGVNREDLIRLRDEAHRFAIQYHKSLRDKKIGRNRTKIEAKSDR